MVVILFAIPLFFILIGIELFLDKRRKTGFYRANDAITSLTAGIMSRVVALGYQLIPLTMYVLVFDSLALIFLPNALWVWLLAFVLYDFLYYWNHRMGHEMSILWAAHVVHHSSEDYNLTTALRQTSGALFSWIFYLPMAVLGFPPEMVITVGALNLVYQFWVHTQHINKLGWMEKWFVTPSNHRAHHAQNRVYIDKNYGGVFIVWDRLFNTYTPELESDPPVYGIRGALRSFNPLWANLQLYSQLARDSYYTSRWRDKLRVWFGRTGWRPNDVAARFPLPKAPLSDFERYDPKLPSAVTFYSISQHVILLGITLFFLLSFDTISGVQQLVIAATIIVMGIQNGFILAGSKWSLALEGPRLIVFPLMWLVSGLVLPSIFMVVACLVSLIVLFRTVNSSRAQPSEAHATQTMNTIITSEPDNVV